jgi:hypothetical protein
VVLLARGDKPFWLFDVDDFVERRVEEGGVDIHLMDFGFAASEDGK